MNQAIQYVAQFSYKPDAVAKVVFLICAAGLASLWKIQEFGFGWNGLLGQLQLALLGLVGFKLSWLWFFDFSETKHHDLKNDLAYLAVGNLLCLIFCQFASFELTEIEGSTRTLEVLLASLGIHSFVVANGLWQPESSPDHPQLPSNPIPRHTEHPSQRTPLFVEGILAENFLAIQVQDHYCTLYFQDKDQINQQVIYGKLADFEQQLEGCLHRVSRSALVNLKQIESVGTGRNPVITLKQLDVPFTISRARKTEILSLL